MNSNLLVHAHLIVPGFTLEKSGRPTNCAAILVYCSVKDWSRFCYVMHRIRRPTRYRIRCGFIFSTIESGLKNIRIRCRIRWILVDGSSIRKEKVADSKISRYLWTRTKATSHHFYHDLINLKTYIDLWKLNNDGFIL